jgi:hypothetical protein
MLSALVYAAALWFPPFGLLLCLTSPLPLAAAAWRRGGVGAAVAILGGIGLAAATTGWMGAGMYAAQFAVGGCLLGLALRRELAPEAVVGVYALAAIAGFWALVGVMAASSGTNPEALLASTVAQAAEQAKELLLRGDRSPEAVASVQQWADQTGRGQADGRAQGAVAA